MPSFAVDDRSVVTVKLIPAILLAVSAVMLFGVQNTLIGYALLGVSVAAATVSERRFGGHVALIALGLVIISLVPLNADLSTEHMLLMGAALAGAVIVPTLISRRRERVIHFPVRTGRRWSWAARLYLPGVVLLGWAVLPAYLINTGVYLNWPDASADPSTFWRLFVGVNSVGIWDELFFICITFALLREHFPMWVANLLQAPIFASFLWEIGYQSWGPLLTVPFALLQGYTFTLTRSLSYVITVHLLFDAVLFVALVHAHNREWMPIFWY